MNHSPSITVIILTFNEEVHLKRCIDSVIQITSQIIIVDSYSTDQTLKIAEQASIKIYQNPFVNQAQQFQWGLDQIDIKTDWIMRIDADEYLTPKLIKEINEILSLLDLNITGIILKRQVHFMGKWIKHGGYYPTKLLRIWRNGTGAMEQRWMDEHIKLSHGHTIELKNDFVDDNLNNLNWWISKHNNYSTREAVDLLNKEYNFFEEDSIITGKNNKKQDEKKRWYKDNIYAKMPLFFRAFIYFLFRYFFKLGFMDGKPGLIWHFLQGFWYRFLVDAKIFQIKYLAQKHNKSIRDILTQDFGIKL